MALVVYTVTYGSDYAAGNKKTGWIKLVDGMRIADGVTLLTICLQGENLVGKVYLYKNFSMEKGPPKRSPKFNQINQKPYKIKLFP